MLEAETAASIIAENLAAGKNNIYFPLLSHWGVRVLAFLPPRVSVFLLRRLDVKFDLRNTDL